MLCAWKVQADARDYQASLEAEVEEERHQAEHQLRVLARSNEAECHEVSTVPLFFFYTAMVILP